MRSHKLFFVSWFLFAAVYATTADNSQPVVITSNTLSGDLNQHLAVFNGTVVATQGTRVLESDKASIYFNKAGQINDIKAEGSPAKTTETLDAKGNKVYGEALIIEYFPLQRFIQYEEEAVLKENGNIFKGNLITYNIVNQVIASPQTKGNTGATTIILPPSTPTTKS